MLQAQEQKLLIAANNGNIDDVKLAIQAGVDPNVKRADKASALHLAAWCGHVSIVKFLLEKGAELESRGAYGWTPLHYAAHEAKLETVKFLLEKGASADLKETYPRECTPSALAKLRGHHVYLHNPQVLHIVDPISGCAIAREHYDVATFIEEKFKDQQIQLKEDIQRLQAQNAKQEKLIMKQHAMLEKFKNLLWNFNIKPILQSTSVGPRKIPNWILQDVVGDGNCFYHAIAHQLEKTAHAIIKEVPQGTSIHDFLRLKIQGPGDFKDGEWTEDKTFYKLVEHIDVILAVADTRSTLPHFVFYYRDQNDTVVIDPTGNQPLPDKPIIKIAGTGDHFLSVISHPDVTINNTYCEFSRPQRSFSKSG